MITKMDDLKEIVEEVKEYLKRENFTIFYGIEMEGESSLAEVHWTEEDSGWKGFLQAAKETGTRLIVIQASPLKEKDLEEMLETENEEEETKPTEVPEELKEHIGKIGHFNLFWFKDGVKYVYSQSTEWWEMIADLLAEEIEEEDKIPDEIMKKPAEQLADELVAFIEEFPDATYTHSLTSLFWESKGLEEASMIDDVQFEIKRRKVGSLAEIKLEKKNQKKEKELIPKLVEDCVKWARESGFKKITKANVDHFLYEKKQALSKTSRDAIYSKVNLALTRK
jgi:hypothetical protein